ncbi:T9SS type A sorting domain-containing protein [Gelidibacter salicanalis]|uniref:T9SS type A sorting domain-containing protein n=1 Tax=Gelidibacter salicanalis TaxID=291193 RepID=A0A5C7ABK3_9FLAO|nr:T9SS type A sorting domain-containing protein [Gelidibacter salicanalis]TXE05781.1 T9SS type A sorting domain-containing protein [Gelidibacter salicanalis]
MKNFYLFTISYILLALLAYPSFSKTKVDATIYTSTEINRDTYYGFKIETVKPRFKGLDVSGFTSSQYLFINRFQSKTLKQETHTLLNAWATYQAFSLSSLFYSKMILEDSARPYACSATVTISSDATNNTICAGNSVIFTATSVNGGSAPKYQWQVNAVNVGTSSTINTFTPPQPLQNGHVVTVILTSDLVDCGTLNTVSDNLTIAVNPIPSAPTAGNDGPVCEGGIIHLTAGTINGATYSWIGPNSFTSTDQNPTVSGASAAMAGTYNVTATVSGCTSNAGSTNVIVNPIPSAPTASSNGPVCEGGTIELTASFITGATYYWTGPNNFTSTAQNPIISGATAPMDGIYSVSATVSGCTSEAANTSVIVNPIPSAPVANNAGPVCAGGTINLTASTIADATYSWIGPNGFTSTAQNPVITNAAAAMAGIYNVTATVSGCTSSIGTTTVVVNPIPSAPTAGSNGPVCVGGTINLTASTFAGAIYSWTGPGGFSSSTQNPSISVATAAMNGTYSVTATVSGCTSIAGTTEVIVNPIPTAPTAGSNGPVCVGETINLTATAISGATYSWTGPNNFTSTAQSPSISVASAAMAGNYNVTATVSGSGCTSNVGTINVVVNPIPSAPTTISNISVCANGTINLTASTISGATYSWTGPNGFTSNTQNPSISSATGATAGNYNVTATVSGCTSGVATTTVVVNPTVTPTVSITSSSTSICATAPSGSTPVTFTATPVNGGTSPSYQWKNGTTSVGTNSPTYVANSLAIGSQISVVMTSSATCTSSATATSDIIPMTSYTPPTKPVFVASSGNVNVKSGICPPASGLIYRVNSDDNISNYDWSIPNGWVITNGAGTNTITVDVTGAAGSGGNYNIRANAKNTCGTSSQETLVVSVNKSASLYAGLDASICMGGSIALSGENNGYANKFNWTANPAVGAFSNSTDLKPTYTPPASYTGIIKLSFISTQEPGNVNCPVVADEMILTVNAPPAITAQPSIASQTLCLNTAATQLSVTATGAGLTYQWYSNTTNSNTGGISLGAGATSSTYTPKTNAVGALYYYVTVSGTCTPALTSSVSGKVTVNAPPAITGQPSTTPQTLCLNATATQLSVTATGAGTTIQWYSNTAKSNSGGTSLGSGANSSTYTPSTNAAGTLYYYAVVSGTCTPPVTSNVSGLVTVNAPPAITGQPSTTPQTLCLNDAPTELSVTATGTGLKYQWYSNTANSNSGGTSLGAGATSSTYTPLASAAGTLYYYYVIVSGTCTPPVTSSVSGLVTVNSAPAITVQPSISAQTLCLNESATELSITATGAGRMYQWYSNTTNSNSGGTSLGAGATSATYTPLASAAGTLYYYVIVSGTCTPPVSSNVSGAVTVSTAAAITVQPSTTAQTLCLNAAATQLSVTATGAGLKYQWYSNTANSNSGGTSLGASATSATYTPLTSTAGTLYYYVSVSGTCAPPETSNVSGLVTVNAAPAITTQPSSTSQTLCLNGAATELSVTATGPGLSYQWYSNTANSNSGGTSLGAGATSENYTPKTTASGTLYYYVIVSGTCTPPVKSNVSGSVTVNAPPAITGQPATSQTICSGFSVSFSVSATGSGISYQWQKGGTNIAGATASTYTINNTILGDAGTYTVVVKGISPCGNVTSTDAVLNVNEDIKIDNQPTTPQTICEGSSTTMSVAATGTGLSYQWRKGGFPISNGGNITGATTNTLTFTGATESNSGSYDVVVSATDGTCLQTISKPANLKVNPNNTITLTSAVNTDNQTLCINTTLTEIKYATTGATGALFSGLPAGITGTWANNTVKINGIATEVGGPFNYTVTLTGGCGDAEITGTINVDPFNTITLTSASGTNAQSVCINTPLTDITYATTGATGATFSGLPAGVTGTWINNTVKISGTPTVVDGPTNYTVTLTGGCSVAPMTGTINVDPTNSITLTSASGTDAQSVCINTSLTDITYATTGATGATFSGLPAGVTGTWVNNTVKISGTPTAEDGPTTYTVTLTGGCSVAPITGTINVDPTNSFTLTSASDTDAQSVCKNTPLTDITYATTGATGATFSGLPAGVTGTWVNNTVKISGTPTAAGGPTTYTVTLTGGCSIEPIAGTINVDPTNTFSLTSASTSTAQSVCIDTQITNITYATTGATGASFSGLPAGVTGAWSGNIVTISGKPTEVGSFDYTVTLTGGCIGEKPKGTITVKPSNTITLTSASGTNAQSLCVNTPLTDITYVTTGATGASFSGLPAGVTGTWVNNIVKISGTPTAAGGPTIYTITLTGGCSVESITGTIKIDPKPVGGELLFSGLNKATYLVCHNATSGSARAIELTGATGSVVKWQTTDNPSVPTSWTDIPNTENTYSYSGYSGLTKTTLFRAVISSGSCGLTYSKFAVISVIPADIKPSPVQASFSEVCFGTQVKLTSQLNYSTSTQIAGGGSFNNANPTGWIIDEDPGNNFPANGNNTRPNRWSETNDHPFDTRDGSITFDSGDKKFAIVSGKNLSTMETPTFNTFGLSEATLRFQEAFIMNPNTTMKIELSLDGGENYTIVLRDGPFNIEADGVARTKNYGNFSGNIRSFDLSQYVGLANLKIKFTFDGRNDPNNDLRSIWAIDNIAIANPPLNIASVWTYTNAQGEVITVNNQQNITVTPDKIGLNTYTITSFIVTDDGSECRSADPNNSETVSIYVFDKYTSTAKAPSPAACGKNDFQLEAQLKGLKQGSSLTFPTPDGYDAPFWEVVGIAPTDYSFSNPDSNDTSDPIKNPNAIFNALNEGAYTLRWTMSRSVNDIRVNPCPPVYTSIVINVQNCIALDFDGVDDFVDIGDYTGNYSIEAWIRPEASTGTIISTKNREINMSNLPTVIPNTRWYHIAVDSNGQLYLDGINTGTTISASGTSRSFIGAKWTPPNATNFFSGWIEEVRIWNGNISQDQIRFLMNQRLQSGANIGVEIPMPAPGLPYTNLVGYYKLLSNNILSGGYTPNLASTANGKLRNMTTLQENSAPLPYVTKADGSWNTIGAGTPWSYGDSVWDYPNSTGFNNTPIDWNIVRTSNNILSGDKDITVLGLLVDANKLSIKDPTVTIKPEENDGQGLRVTHYLKLNGIIDLVGESQLIQDEGGILDPASTGNIKRDQQGTGNLYNYNYWGSPVVSQGGAANSFTIASVLKDGTSSASPGTITWTTGRDGTPGPPIQISSRWLTTYANSVSNTYSAWVRINEGTVINSGLGYTMKGSGATTATQNYVFIGKPNNGTITNLISAGNDALIGNPYPSAIDADEFIKDNISSLGNVSLKFWDHFGVNNTHILREYEGGYATYNLSGGIMAVKPLPTADGVVIVGGNGVKRPGRYIPVGQGFFVSADSTKGGDIIFKNSQRVFQREVDGSSIFLRGVDGGKSGGSNYKTNTPKKDSIKRIRLEFKSPEGGIRPLLLGFVPNNLATDGVDYGYDAVNRDAFPNDLSWLINESKYIIQGVGAFEDTKKFPFAMQLSKDGAIEIKLTELENFSEDIAVYIYDSLLDTYHQINNTSFEISLSAGNYDKRFYLAFKDDNTLSIIDEDFKNVVVKFLQNTDEIFIQTPNEVHVKQVYLVNIIGQTVQAWNATNTTISNEMKIPVRNLPDGNYVIKIQTDTGIVNKKIVLKF